jgi:hypothetical protein
VRGAEDGAAVERQDGQSVCLKRQQVREVFVGLLLPAGRPYQFETACQPFEPFARIPTDTVDDPVDVVEGPRRFARWKAEKADHAVDIDEQNRGLRRLFLHFVTVLCE